MDQMLIDSQAAAEAAFQRISTLIDAGDVAAAIALAESMSGPEVPS